MNLVQWARRESSRASQSPWPAVTLDQLPYWFGQFGYQGLGYGPAMIQSSLQANKETIQADFVGYIQGAYKTNGAIFALMLTRMMLFSEARFQFRDMNHNGRPGKLFGTNALAPLETPWHNGTTGDLLSRMILDVDTAGNFYAVRLPDKSGRLPFVIRRMRPDWVTIILGSYDEPDVDELDPAAELVGFMYQPGGYGSGHQPKFYLPEQVCHFAPIPDPLANFRGQSWIQPVLTEVIGDRAMNTHKTMFFENGATPNLVVSMDTGKMGRQTFKEWVDTFENEHSGAINAYKTLYLGHGASASVVGSQLKDLDYAIVQGHGETRLAAAARVPPIIVGFSEGLSAATYSNYGQARRHFADGTLRPLWRNAAGSLAPIIDVPGGSQLWYDDRDIPFLQADAQDLAEEQTTKSTAIRLLVDAGYDPETVVQAIEANDFTQLKHTGMYSVQLQPPGAQHPVNVDPLELPTKQQPKQLPAGGTNSQNDQRSISRAVREMITTGELSNVEALAQALKAAKAGH